MQTSELSSKIKTLCRLKKIPVKVLLEECGMNRNTIYDLEHKGAYPSYDKILKIADYLNVSLDYLFGRTNNYNRLTDIKMPITTYKIDMADVFNPDNIMSKYVFYLWNARNDSYAIEPIFTDSINQLQGRKKDLDIILKYKLLILFEASNLILCSDKALKKFESIRDELKVWRAEQVKELNTILENKFLKKIRNTVAHFDREKNSKDIYFDAIKKQKTFTVSQYDLNYNYNGSQLSSIFYDEDSTVFTNFVIESYKTVYCTNDEKISDEVVLNMAIKSLLKITELVFFILNGMIDYYLWNYTNLANHPKIIRTTRRYCENSTQPKFSLADGLEDDIRAVAYGLDNEHYIPEDDEDEIKTT